MLRCNPQQPVRRASFIGRIVTQYKRTVTAESKANCTAGTGWVTYDDDQDNRIKHQVRVTDPVLAPGVRGHHFHVENRRLERGMEVFKFVDW